MFFRFFVIALLFLLPVSAYANQEVQDIPAVSKSETSEKGEKMEPEEQTTAIDLSTLKTLPDVIESVSDKKIVYVGEYHDRFSHHDVQLQVIKGLYKKNKKIAIGMEMFQRPFQKILEEYIAGKIDEKDFLKGTEYFKRWVFDYNLYKPILDFAKAEKLPVIALNLQREITEKVSRGGIDSLAPEEKKDIPEQLDFSDNEYKEKLKKIFNSHNTTGKNFDFFYQNQILWDETMSMSIDDFLKKNPDYQMVVIAGSGHVAYGSGIPRRTFRRNGHAYSIVLNDMDIDKNAGNYVIFPKHIEGAASPKLMVFLKEEYGRLFIEAFPENSISEKAGLRAGDMITYFDDSPVRSLEDLKINLQFRKKGDTVKVRVVRKRILFGDKEMVFEVTL